MKKTQELENLFEEWIKSDSIFENDFFKDGIVCPEEWEKTQIKILFVLKEVHNKGSRGIYNFLESDDIQNGYKEKSTMWRKVISLAYGILNYKTVCFEDIDQKMVKDNEKLYTDIVKKIAIMNIKKSGGGSTVDSLYTKQAKKFGDKIKKEIEIISPDIIVCCNTFYELKKYVFDDEWQDLTDERFKIQRSKNCVLIFNNYHPVAWGWKCTKQQYLLPIIEALNKRDI